MTGVFEQYQANVEPGPEFDDGRGRIELPLELPARLIAFYLPQFHAIPENDRAWGPGFTEWTNVTKTLPWFPGHYQPRLPGTLGFYDLARPEALKRQAELARRYGIHGFCFHYYWFRGRRLLERPLDNLLNDRSIDLPFCVNWANENWSRRWDGRESEVLIAQDHSPDDDQAFAESLAPMFDDSRYIRVAGRPLLLIYRPRLFPDAAQTINHWRDYFGSRGEEPLFLMVQGFEDFDPTVFGLDGAVGFPPFGIPDKPQLIQSPPPFHPSFAGSVRSYAQLALRSSSYWPTHFRYYPGICPSWDNTARRKVAPGIFHGSSPTDYGAWLETVVRQVRQRNSREDRLVFVNAWNEWAEGAYLEPDRHYGNAFLAETARRLSRVATTGDSDPAQPLATLLGETGGGSPTLGRRVSRKLGRELSRAAMLLASW